MKFFVVPKFIEKETKILGPLTFKQTFVLGTGLVILVIVYFFAKKFFGLAIFIVAPICILIAFFKISGIPITTYVANMIRFQFEKKVYSFSKEISPQKEIVYLKPKKTEIPLKMVDGYLKKLMGRIGIK